MIAIVIKGPAKLYLIKGENRMNFPGERSITLPTTLHSGTLGILYASKAAVP